MKPPMIHPTANIESGVEVGDGTAIWDHVHIRKNTRIGKDCIVGEKTYIAYDVEIGDRVKINAFVYICAGVTIETGAMISAGVIFANDRYPRATTADLSALLTSEPTAETLQTRVGQGATIGAGARIAGGINLGQFCMVGMGAVVTKSVPPFALVVGNPARLCGAVCRCGKPILKIDGVFPQALVDIECQSCSRRFLVDSTGVKEADLP